MSKLSRLIDYSYASDTDSDKEYGAKPKKSRPKSRSKSKSKSKPRSRSKSKSTRSKSKPKSKPRSRSKTKSTRSKSKSKAKPRSRSRSRSRPRDDPFSLSFDYFAGSRKDFAGSGYKDGVAYRFGDDGVDFPYPTDYVEESEISEPDVKLPYTITGFPLSPQELMPDSRVTGYTEFLSRFEKSQELYNFQIVFTPTLEVKQKNVQTVIPLISNYIYNRPHSLKTAKEQLDQQNYNKIVNALEYTKPIVSRASIFKFTDEFKTRFLDRVLPSLQANAVAFLDIPKSSQGTIGPPISGKSSFVRVHEYKGKLIVRVNILHLSSDLERLLRQNGVNADKLTRIQIYNLVKTTLLHIIQKEVDTHSGFKYADLEKSGQGYVRFKMEVDLPTTVFLDKTLVEEKDLMLSYVNPRDYPTILSFNPENIVYHNFPSKQRATNTFSGIVSKDKSKPPTSSGLAGLFSSMVSGPVPVTIKKDKGKERISSAGTAETSTPSVPRNNPFYNEYVALKTKIQATRGELQGYNTKFDEQISIIESVIDQIEPSMRLVPGTGTKEKMRERKIEKIRKGTLVNELVKKATQNKQSITQQNAMALQDAINEVLRLVGARKENRRNLKQDERRFKELVKNSKNPRKVEKKGRDKLKSAMKKANIVDSFSLFPDWMV